MHRRRALKTMTGLLVATSRKARAGPLVGRADPGSALDAELASCRECLVRLRRRSAAVRALPDVPFVLFGAGPRRPKLVYRRGVLQEDSGGIVRRWEVAGERFVPSACAVLLELEEGGTVLLEEDEEGLWIEDRGGRTALARSPVRFPTFEGHRWGPVLRALHHEILINVTEAGPLPNRVVYRKPWYRDGAMVAMVMKETGNLDLLRPWISSLREPFDRNNAGEAEADNPGQALYLASLVSDRSHPVVSPALAALRALERRSGGAAWIEGRSDFAAHPVYQTKWAKWGLRSLGLPDPYVTPRVFDQYSALFWWAFRDEHVPGPGFDASGRLDYPYLAWAEDHFRGTAGGPVGGADRPLTWESRASQADYEALRPLAPSCADARLAAPHTWHAAEMFLALAGEGRTTP